MYKESLDYGTQNNWKAFRQSNQAFKGKQCRGLRLSGHRKYYSPDFLKKFIIWKLQQQIPIFRRQAENQQLQFKSSNSENYNNPFSLDELTDAISKYYDTAVGPDAVHYQMLKHLPNDALLTLFRLLLGVETDRKWFFIFRPKNKSPRKTKTIFRPRNKKTVNEATFRPKNEK